MQLMLMMLALLFFERKHSDAVLHRGLGFTTETENVMQLMLMMSSLLLGKLKRSRL